jgi:LTXXQ motif family protein
MKRALIAALAALGVGAFAIPLTAVSAQSDQQPSHADRAGQWAADREAMLDAKLSGMKAGLQLTPDQEKLWAPFESAVKDADQARIDAMRRAMQAAREQGERMSPIDHLEAMADRLSRGAADVRKIADAAKPLYASLDDSQKHSFGMLGRMLVPERAEAAEMTHRHMGEGERDGDE